MSHPEPEILDCGHPPTPTDPGVAGYATGPEGKRICYACADAAHVAMLARLDHSMGYFAYDLNGTARITTWTGGTLVTVTSWHESRHFVPGALFRVKLIHWQGTDAHGNRWYGRGPGLGMYTRMHKSKRQPKKGA